MVQQAQEEALEGRGVARVRRPRPFLSTSAAIGILAALCVVGFVQAVLLFPRLMGVSDAPASSPPPREEVCFLVSRGDSPLVLKPTLDLPEAAGLDAEFLDRSLFPTGERHRWYLLQVGTMDQQPVSLDLAATPLWLHLADGSRVGPAALGSRPVATSSLAPYLRMQLWAYRFGETRVLLDPSGTSRILLAFPERAGSEAVVGATLGERRFEVCSGTQDELDTGLDGQGDIPGARKP